jgi:hypothetical protein
MDPMKKRAIGIAILLATAVLLPIFAGDDSPYEKTLKQMIQSLGKMTATLGSVKDADTAQAARPELKKAIDGFTALRAKADKLPPPEPAEKERIAKQYKPKMEEAIKKLLMEAGRLESVPAAKELLKDLRTVLEAPAPPK